MPISLNTAGSPSCTSTNRGGTRATPLQSPWGGGSASFIEGQKRNVRSQPVGNALRGVPAAAERHGGRSLQDITFLTINSREPRASVRQTRLLVCRAAEEILDSAPPTQQTPLAGFRLRCYAQRCPPTEAVEM